MRLSSKSHWDVPITVGDATLHLLACHPTPPAFDGPEDRNGRRNHDEIRLWKEYLSNQSNEWLVDDAGQSGGFADQHFVICGDLNADPADGSSHNIAIQQLLKHPLVHSKVMPTSDGGVEAARIQGQANKQHKGDARFDTSDFSDRSVGNLRVDYVLPSRTMTVLESRVFWPTSDNPLAKAVTCSDHRLVWVDLQIAKD